MKILVITKRTLITAAVILALIAAAVIVYLSFSPDAAAAGSLRRVEEYELEVLAGRKHELPIYSVERSDKKIALTIDAAWEADKTDFILDTLDKYGIHATFFLCGFWADKYPDKVKEIAARGNEIGNHSSTHPHMSQLTAAEIRKELEKFDDTIEKLLGKRTTAFRCPYGEYNDTVITTARELGYEIWQWSIDTVDWKEERSPQTILESVIPKLEPGCVVLCHNNGYGIEQYLPPLIKAAQDQGYEFVTVSELKLDGDTIIDVNGRQKAA